MKQRAWSVLGEFTGGVGVECVVRRARSSVWFASTTVTTAGESAAMVSRADWRLRPSNILWIQPISAKFAPSRLNY